MVRKKDRFWDHVEEQNNRRFKCKFCGSIFTGGATRIKYHLAGVKGHDINICTKVTKEVQEEASLTIGEPTKKLKGASTSNKDKEREISSTSISKDDMLSKVFEKSKAEYIDEILLGVFVEGLLAKLRSIVIEQHISFELGFKEGLTDLFSFLTQIQLVLTDVEKRQASDEFLRIWLAKLRYVAYDIDDVLDEFGYNILQQKVINYSSPSNDIINMANKIKIINDSLNRLKGDIASYELRAEFVNSIPEISFNMEIDSFLDDSKVSQNVGNNIGQNVGNNIVEATYCDRVIEIMETFTQYELTEYDCWFIFKKRASANERLLTLDLEKIGKEIVKKCKRVPWAAEFLGRIMYFIHDKGEWLSIQNNKNWDLLDDRNNGVFHILKLGYDHLRIPSLKRCFAYCAIFPKDCNMKKDEVIQHWMAEGFLEPSKEGTMAMEDIGNTYFNILLATLFFQNARKDVCGDIISCKMNNLVHDFAISISKSEILILEGDFVDNVRKVQHLFVRSDCKTTPRTSLCGDSFIKVRTLISENLDFDDMLSNFKCLRVLKLSGHNIIRLPNSIEQLIHLRLLHILHTKIEELPKSITKLYNLQTLRIEECPKLMGLPEDLSNLINLRHINIYVGCWTRIHYRDCLLKNMGRLTCLQTLNIFIVGREEGYWIKEMGPLKNLRGEINIYNLEEVKDEEEAKSAKLKEKEILKLGLFWNQFCGELDMYDIDKDEKVLEGLHPHPNLKSLTIEWYRGKKFPSWVNDLSQFHNLICIKWNFCTKCEEVPTLGHLPCLRVLEIEGMGKVRSIGSEFYSYSDGSYRNTTKLFPALRILKLEKMETLEEWKDAKELTSAGEVLLVFPCLEELIIIECNNLRDLPNSLHTHVSLRKLVVKRCPNLSSLPGVPSVIQHLEIIGCGIDEPPSGLQFCTSLQYLEIWDCTNLKSIPESLQTCVSLQKFIMRDCPHLRYLPGVPSLIQHLEIIGCGIDEPPSGLQFCTSLQYLEIGDCTNLKSIPESLQTCVSLQKFIMRDCPHLRYLPGVPSVIQHLEIRGCGIDEPPSGLQFCTSLQYLEIGDCTNLKSIPESLQACVSLQKFIMRDCPHLRYLPGVPSVIQHLEIRGCGIDEPPSGLQFCTSLQYLEIRGCTNLKSIPESLQTCVSLQKFIMRDCPHLRYLPGVPSVIQHLEIRGCGIDEPPSGLQFCTSLQYLEIGDCTNLKSIPESLQTCVSLQKFIMRDCPLLRYLPGVPSVIQHLEIRGCGIDEPPSGLQFCTSLQYLEIRGCTNLKSIPESLQTCVSLQKFIMRDCPLLRYLPGVPSVIQHLEIRGCGIDEPPSGLQFCTSLQYLEIGDCTNLKSIPESLQTCVSLQKFIMRDCPHLRYLPGVPSVIQHLEIIGCGIVELPSGLQFCTSLQYLEIGDCTNLKSIPESLWTCVSLQKFIMRDCPHLRYLPDDTPLAAAAVVEVACCFFYDFHVPLLVDLHPGISCEVSLLIIQWVMPDTIVSLLFAWRNWLGTYSSNVWNMANAIETIGLLFVAGGTIDYNCKLMNRGGMYILNVERAIFKDKEEAGVGLIIRVAQGLLIAVMSKRSLCMNPMKSR
ncbi:putative disease resistance protein At3g14460 [Quercus robur]|uniref:putative disease resistance protein At3g14460 n=1 Tax=Quercus robur TaxID=38942 RepID=UPI002162EEFB|nr:putative disease resistance protein At3g14460 [Quercus robur]